MKTRAGQIILTPVRIKRGDAVRAKLAELDLSNAHAWSPVLAAEPVAGYGAADVKAKTAARKNPASKKPASKA